MFPNYTSYDVAPLAAFQVSVGVVTPFAALAGEIKTGVLGGDPAGSVVNDQGGPESINTLLYRAAGS